MLSIVHHCICLASISPITKLTAYVTYERSPLDYMSLLSSLQFAVCILHPTFAYPLRWSYMLFPLNTGRFHNFLKILVHHPTVHNMKQWDISIKGKVRSNPREICKNKYVNWKSCSLSSNWLEYIMQILLKLIGNRLWIMITIIISCFDVKYLWLLKA